MEICEAIIPGISEDEMARSVGKIIYDRGVDYYEHGAVTEVVKLNNLLKAVVGRNYSYKVKITINGDIIEEASCSCPYEGYYCKHTVAVLLYCLNSPEQVKNLDNLTKRLKNFSKEYAIEIIEELIKNDAELAEKILKKLDTVCENITDESSSNLIDPAPYREDAEEILSNVPYEVRSYEDHEFAEDCMCDLIQIIYKAEEFSDKGEGNNAIVILKEVTEAYFDSCPHVDHMTAIIDDFFYHLNDVWSEAILTAELSANERSDFLEQLSHYQKEISNYKTNSFDKAIAALEEGWDNGNLKLILSGKASAECKINNDLVRMRLKILAYKNRFEEYLNLAKHAEFKAEYICMLVQQGRLEESTNVAKAELCNVSDAFEVAKKLRDCGHVERAVEIATKGLELEESKFELGKWLSDLAESLGNKDLAKTALTHSFKESIRLDKYEKILKLTSSEELEKTKKDLLNHVREEKSSFCLEDKADIFLSENLFDDAIAIAEKPGLFYSDVHILRKVMEAVVSYNPAWVINNGERRAMPIIDGGQAKHYSDAVAWLKLIQKAYKASGKDEEWNSLLNSIRNKHGTKPKLMGLMQNAFG